MLSAGSMEHELAKLFECAVSYLSDVVPRLQDMLEFSRMPVGDRERLKDDFRKRRKCIESCLDLVIAPPVGLGHRRTNLVHKLHALTHQLYLLLGKSLYMGTKQLVSFCTDFGVESSLAKTRSIPLNLLCPYAASSDLDLEGEGLPPIADAAPACDEDGMMIQYSSALQVPGALHILHNLTDDVLSTMEHFLEVKAPMKILSRGFRLLSNRGIVQRGHRKYSQLFRVGVSKVNMWKKILKTPLENILQHTYFGTFGCVVSMAKYVFLKELLKGVS